MNGRLFRRLPSDRRMTRDEYPFSCSLRCCAGKTHAGVERVRKETFLTLLRVLPIPSALVCGGGLSGGQTGFSPAC